jgi:hypothetical protein
VGAISSNRTPFVGAFFALHYRMFQQLQRPLLRAILGALGLSFCGPMATASSKLHPHAEFLKNAPNSRLTITRYSGHPDFNSQQSLAWSLADKELYIAGNTIYTRRQEGLVGPCESLIADQQKFALRKMAKTHYLKDDDVPKYIRLGESFDTGQVNYAVRTRDVSRADAERIAGRGYDDYINHLIRDHDSDKVPLITATMWSVAGQMLDPFSQQLILRPAPWQQDPERKQLAAEFDRRKYKVLFEWGRTAQDVPREAEPLGSVLTAINYQESKALGYSIEDAWVMFHSFDEVNTRAYSLRFPNRLYPPAWSNKNDALFLVPLSEALKAFPPSRHSAKLRRLIEASSGKLDELKAMDFLQEFNRIQFTLLDIVNRGVQMPRPIAIRDVSTGAAIRRELMIKRYGLHEIPTIEQFARAAMTLAPVLPQWNSGQFTDLADLDMSVYDIQHHNAVEISNLDRAPAVFDKTYVPRMLLATFTWYVKNFAETKMNQDFADQVIHELSRHDVKFAMTTFDPVLMQQIRALKPISETKHHYPQPEGFKAPDFRGQEWMSMGYIHEPITFYFTVEQIVKLANAMPEVYQAAFHSVEEKLWARYLMLTNPDIF